MTQSDSTHALGKSGENTGSSVAVVVALICWLLVAAASKWAYQPPSPLSVDSPTDVFSAERAEKHLQELVGDGIPHPAGSEQNKVVGDRVIAILRSMGYEDVQEQNSSQPIRFSRELGEPQSVPIRNLYAIKQGDSELGAVMLVCHYDSVPYGPGASDDGVGVAAVLEIAKMAQSFSEPGRDVVFMFTDGEEYGLLGAKAFVDENELVDEIEFVVNLEARGTSGSSLMFQTSNDSAQMISIFAKTAARPVSSSIFEEIYKRLPNDTDFTIFRDQAKMRGFNFAFIGDARNYHTPNDNFETADRGSLQHHGQNAWGLVKQLRSLPDLPTENRSVVYFDFFGRVLLSWNVNLAVVASGIVLVAYVVWFFVLNWGTQHSRLMGFGISLASIVGVIAFAVMVCWFLNFSFNLQERFRPPWVDCPELVSLSFWSFGVTAAIWLSSWINVDEEKCWFVTWFCWSLIAVLVSSFVVGASYLFLIPPLAAWVIRLMFSWVSSSISNILSTILAALIWMPIGVLFYEAMGFSMNGVLMFRIAFMISTLLPIVVATSKPNLGRLAIAGVAISILMTCFAIGLNPV